MSTERDEYFLHVIRAGDDASEHFKAAAKHANQKSLAHTSGILKGNRLLVPKNGFVTQQATSRVDAGHEIQTDGVGTKVRIYMRAFNEMYERYKADKSTHGKEQLEAIARDLFYRMFLDLYAMNVDDFRHGDIALAVSDILDIDHITLTGDDAEQGEIFCTAFSHAIGRVIETTKIACIAGETAILGDDDKLKDTRANLGDIVDGVLRLEETSKKIGERIGGLPSHVECLVIEVRQLLTKALKAKQKQVRIDRSISLNLGGSTTGYRNSDKLIPLAENQVVIGLFEKKTEKGIISPRANGISAIRASMEKLLGKEWTILTLQDYFDALDAKLIPIDREVRLRLSRMGPDTPLWDIATGETTVFNPLVAGTLLGGIENGPLFPNSISGQIHVTGNPVGKWSDVVADSGLGINIDYTGVEIPQIIEMCMIAERQNFADGMKKFNMGIPYALICSEEQEQNVLSKIQSERYEARRVGRVTKPAHQEKAKINIKYPDGDSFSKPVTEIRE